MRLRSMSAFLLALTMIVTANIGQAETGDIVIAFDETAEERLNPSDFGEECQKLFSNSTIMVVKAERVFSNTDAELAAELDETRRELPGRTAAAVFFREGRFTIALLKPGASRIFGRSWEGLEMSRIEFAQFAALALKNALIEIDLGRSEAAAAAEAEPYRGSRAFSLPADLSAFKKPAQEEKPPVVESDEDEKLSEEKLEPLKEKEDIKQQVSEKQGEAEAKDIEGEVERPEAMSYSLFISPFGAARYQPSAQEFVGELGAAVSFGIEEELFFISAGAAYSFEKSYESELGYKVSVWRLPMFLEAGSRFLRTNPSLALSARFGGEFQTTEGDERLKNAQGKTLINPFFSAVQRLWIGALEWLSVNFVLEERIYIRRPEFTIGSSAGVSKTIYSAERWELLFGLQLDFYVWRTP